MSRNYVKKHMADYHADLIESLKDDNEAEAYLQIALEEYNEDGDYEALMLYHSPLDMRILMHSGQ